MLINIFDKNFNFSFCNSSRLSYDVRKYQKINLLVPRSSRNSDNVNILSFFFIVLISFNLLRKQKNDPRLKIILTSTAFLVCILYRSSKPHNRLKSCFTCQFFTHDTIEITNEVNTSHSQSELSIFAICTLDSRTARLWNSLPMECFPLTYDLSGFKSSINRHLLTVGSF